MALAKKKQQELFTYADYLTWDDGERWELIEGEVCNMIPAPNRFHQKILEINLSDMFRVSS